MSFLSLHHEQRQGVMKLEEDGGCGYQNLVHKQPETSNLSPIQPFSEGDFLFYKWKPHRRRSTGDLELFVPKDMSVYNSEETVTSPVKQLIPQNNNAKEKICLELRSTFSENQATKSKPFWRHLYKQWSLNNSLSSHLRFRNSKIVTPKVSPCSSILKGVIQLVSKGEKMFFIFTSDDKGNNYIANPWKVKYSDDRSLDYVYLLHSRRDAYKNDMGDCLGDASDIVGKMTVSSHLTFSSNKSKVLEMEFVLFGVDGHFVEEICNLATIPRKNRVVPKKIANMLRAGRISKHKPTLSFGALNESQRFDGINQLDPYIDILLKNHLPHNLELAAIIVKKCIKDSDNNNEKTMGGWGLNFLKKGTKGTTLSSSRPWYNLENDDDHSACINILLPSGFHGIPINNESGPSRLVDRWKSGGSCDCGGWDMGCPLSILKDRANLTKDTSLVDSTEVLDLFIEDGKGCSPALKMTTIHKDVCLIEFQKNLTALQSFSVAVAVIHTRSQVLCQNIYYC